eukprot:gnl/Chilomastix_cuspidata/67.p1 GENE.gnl/Chilomastix_cuspidata/67~~gnl/Chilomastix_cuspidata/67.p1  ORF type:complete len:505 (-),score=109.89 gnl/Chilomastix_cuspidata/67:815-2257(-)
MDLSTFSVHLCEFVKLDRNIHIKQRDKYIQVLYYNGTKWTRLFKVVETSSGVALFSENGSRPVTPSDLGFIFAEKLPPGVSLKTQRHAHARMSVSTSRSSLGSPASPSGTSRPRREVAHELKESLEASLLTLGVAFKLHVDASTGEYTVFADDVARQISVRCVVAVGSTALILNGIPVLSESDDRRLMARLQPALEAYALRCRFPEMQRAVVQISRSNFVVLRTEVHDTKDNWELWVFHDQQRILLFRIPARGIGAPQFTRSCTQEVSKKVYEIIHQELSSFLKPANTRPATHMARSPLTGLGKTQSEAFLAPPKTARLYSSPRNSSSTHALYSPPISPSTPVDPPLRADVVPGILERLEALEADRERAHAKAKAAAAEVASLRSVVAALEQELHEERERTREQASVLHAQQTALSELSKQSQIVLDLESDMRKFHKAVTHLGKMRTRLNTLESQTGQFSLWVDRLEGMAAFLAGPRGGG